MFKRALLLSIPVHIGLRSAPNPSITYRTVDPSHEKISFHRKNDSDQVYGNIGRLRSAFSERATPLLFAMNGGMFDPDHAPVGLYIDNGKQLHTIDRATKGFGNFLLQPNGVFGILKNGAAFLSTTENTTDMDAMHFATRSGPMLVVDGAINIVCKEDPANLNIRNGVGLKPNGEVVFAISINPINFYDFARWFKDMGCMNALYLDGFVSKAFLPEEKIMPLDGSLDVLIAVEALERR